MLDASAIQQNLKSTSFSKPIQVHVLNSIDSTNQFLKDMAPNNAIDVCCAETQTHGRGRFGRSWYSPLGEDIYFSIRMHFDCDLSELSCLGLVVSLAVLAMLKDIGIGDDVCIKWPNDLLWQDKKLCGSLIETAGTRNKGSDVVIGIGINVNSTIHARPILDKPWCSLYDMTGAHWDRNTLIAKLIIQLDQHIQQLATQGFSSFIPTWQHTDYLYNKLITVSQANGRLSGTAKGINESGQLILVDEMNIMHYLSSGDTSLRI